MIITYSPGDKVICIRDGGCNNGFSEPIAKGEVHTVANVDEHPVFRGIWLLYLVGKSPAWGYNSIHFRKVENE